MCSSVLFARLGQERRDAMSNKYLDSIYCNLSNFDIALYTNSLSVSSPVSCSLRYFQNN